MYNNITAQKKINPRKKDLFMKLSREYLREVSFPVGGIGAGCIGVADFMQASPYLVTSIKAPWFTVSTNALEPYTRIDLPSDYFEGKSSVEDRIEYTSFGDVQQAFLNSNTSYLYLKSLASDNFPETSFTIEVAPNTTGKSRSFALGFPYQSNINGQIYYVPFTVTQE